jgi:hypothetical protein
MKSRIVILTAVLFLANRGSAKRLRVATPFTAWWRMLTPRARFNGLGRTLKRL